MQNVTDKGVRVEEMTNAIFSIYQGARAFDLGHPADVNPYYLGTYEHEDWLAGWKLAADNYRLDRGT